MSLQFGMPAGFGELLAQKYALLQQGANAQSLTAEADSHLTDVRAKLLPGESAAGVGKTLAETAGITESNKYIGDLARSGIGLQSAQARYTNSQAGGEEIANEGFGLRATSGLPSIGGGLGSGTGSRLGNGFGPVDPAISARIRSYGITKGADGIFR